jgi:1,4-alpha-glucan branching enzyme
VDGLRVDGVASMLYLDYSRRAGEWIPNEHGGRENLEAIGFLRRLNEVVYGIFPDIQTAAEESTSWPMVSRPVWVGGLGFGFKWDMGWMNDVLRYFAYDPIHRRYHQDQLTFRSMYACTENFVLPLSHDEVVHGKGSLLAKMPGDAWQQFANLRLLYAFMFAQPGHKLLFQGAELAPWTEWAHDGALDFGLLEWPTHRGVFNLLSALNHVYRAEPALHELDFVPEGFEWVETRNAEWSVLGFERIARDGTRVLCVFNFTPIPREGYRVGVLQPGTWRELLNTDADTFAGSGVGNAGALDSDPVGAQGRGHSLSLRLPPLGALFLRSPQ